jgi:hypothetical protein
MTRAAKTPKLSIPAVDEARVIEDMPMAPNHPGWKCFIALRLDDVSDDVVDVWLPDQLGQSGVPDASRG